MALTEFLEPKECDGELDDRLLALFDECEKAAVGKTYILNPKRIKEFADSFKYLKSVFEPECKVTFKQRQNAGSTGWDMFVRGKSIHFTKTKELSDNVLSKADCFEVSSYLNGVVELAVTFYDMLTRGE